MLLHSNVPSRIARNLVAVAALAFGMAHAQTTPSSFAPGQIATGAKLYADHCSVCHGVKMVEPGGGFFDLRTFPPAQRSRFFNSVTNGKNSMPPWKSVLTQEQIGSIFAYVVAGEKK